LACAGLFAFAGLYMADNTKEEKPSRNFLTKLYAKLKELVGDKVSEDDFNSAVTHARAHAGGKAKAENRKIAGEESLTDMVEKVSRALTQAFLLPITRESIFYWAKEVYLDRCIACSSVDGKYYEIPYAIAGDEVTFGEPVEVEETYTPVGMNELAVLCAHGHGSRLFMEAAFAEPPEWIPYLPKPGEFKHPVYGEILITKDRNAGFVETFKAGVYQERLPVDAEHETKLSGAVGWITDMRVNDDGSADAKVEWTDRGVSLIESDRFKYVSPEWYDVWTEPASGEKHADVAIGAALTTRPFFKEGSLRPLVANERGLYAPDAQKSDPASQTYFSTALAPATDKERKTMADKPEDKGGTAAAPAPDETQKFAEEQTARKAAEARAEKAEGDLKQMGERLATLEQEGRTRRFNDLITTGDWLGQPEKHRKFMEKFGEGTEEFNDYVTEQNAVAEQAKSGNLFGEVGSAGAGSTSGALGEIEAKAKVMCEKDPKLTREQAISLVAQAEPALYSRYLSESRAN
jgi:hypothetical protein